MKATGIVRRIDNLGRVVISKEIRHTIRIREGDITLTHEARFYNAIRDITERLHIKMNNKSPIFSVGDLFLAIFIINIQKKFIYNNKFYKNKIIIYFVLTIHEISDIIYSYQTYRIN